MIGNIIAAIVIGIIAGYLGRALLPGDDSMGFIATVVVGIVGALVGYFLFTSLLGIGDDDKFDLGGILGSIVGVMIVLLVLRAVGGNKGRGGAARGPCPPASGRPRCAAHVHGPLDDRSGTAGARRPAHVAEPADPAGAAPPFRRAGPGRHEGGRTRARRQGQRRLPVPGRGVGTAAAPQPRRERRRPLPARVDGGVDARRRRCGDHRQQGRHRAGAPTPRRRRRR